MNYLNILYHYLSEKYGSLPNILYRIIMSCYPYFLPIRPRFPAALLAIARILLPIVILYFIRWTYREKTQQEQRARRRRSVLKYLIDVVCLLLCVSFVMLVAGVGHYKLLVIGSDSMSGVMDKGDTVIYRKYTDQKIELGDIVLFERDGAVIVHRVIYIESVNGTEIYHTKGDANDAADVGYLTADRVIGISAMRLKYIGYPAVWVRSVGR